MHKIYRFYLLLFLLLSTEIHAQIQVLWTVGLMASTEQTYYRQDNQGNYYECANSFGGYSISPYIKKNFKELGSAHSLGLGVPSQISFQYSSYTSTQGGSSSYSSYGFMLPITLDINGGRYSDQKSSVSYGYWVGAGPGVALAGGSAMKDDSRYSLVPSLPQGEKTYSFGQAPSYFAAGIYVHAGASFEIPPLFNSPRARSVNIGITGGYLKSFTSVSYFNINLLAKYSPGKGAKTGGSSRSPSNRGVSPSGGNGSDIKTPRSSSSKSKSSKKKKKRKKPSKKKKKKKKKPSKKKRR